VERLSEAVVELGGCGVGERCEPGDAVERRTVGCNDWLEPLGGDEGRILGEECVERRE